MKKYALNSNIANQVNIAESGAQWTVAKGVTVSAGSGFYGIYESSGYENNAFIIKGVVTSAQQTGGGLYLGGAGDVVTVASTGVVKGSVSISLQGDNQTINNDGLLNGQISLGAGHYEINNTGTIRSSYAGVIWSGNNVDFHNDGVIKADMTAVLLTNVVTTISLGENSVISGKYGFSRQNDAGLDSRTINNGSLTGTTLSFSGDAGNETLINHGKMSGEIRLYEGDDVFDNRGGAFAGVVSGGDGDDKFYVNSQKITVVEYTNAPGDDIDTVYASVSYALNTAYGVERLVLLGSKSINGAGDNTDNAISGNSGRNRLSGLQGDDTLTGKGGADIFVFSDSFGDDTVTDFKNGADKIDLSGCSDFESFKALKSGHLTFEKGGALISNDGDMLFIANLTKAQLDASDFIF
jgi:Ca2+-binding RTX toxin-like protein